MTCIELEKELCKKAVLTAKKVQKERVQTFCLLIAQKCSGKNNPVGLRNSSIIFTSEKQRVSLEYVSNQWSQTLLKFSELSSHKKTEESKRQDRIVNHYRY